MRITTHWPSVEIVPPPRSQQMPESPAQHDFVTLARGAARLLMLAADAMERGKARVADKDRHDAYEMVRLLGPLTLEAEEQLNGPVTVCVDCGRVEEWDCRCDEQEVF